MIKKFIVCADYPYYSKQANEFLSKLDLGISGGYIKKIEEWEISYSTNNPDIEKTMNSIKNGLLEFGCINIYIWSVQND